jgi:hypothetical protein
MVAGWNAATSDATPSVGEALELPARAGVSRRLSRLLARPVVELLGRPDLSHSILVLLPTILGNVVHDAHRPGIGRPTVPLVGHSLRDTVESGVSTEHEPLIGMRVEVSKPIPELAGRNRLMGIGQHLGLVCGVNRFKAGSCHLASKNGVSGRRQSVLLKE